MADKIYAYSSSPHVKNVRTTKNIMIDVCIALAPACIMGIIYFGYMAAVLVAVSVASGIAEPHVPLHKRHTMAGGFGLFQGVMPIVGFFIGNLFAKQVSAVAPWIAFALLGFIGGKMIFDAVHSSGEEESKRAGSPFGWMNMLLMAVATSIDACAVGLTFALQRGEEAFSLEGGFVKNPGNCIKNLSDKGKEELGEVAGLKKYLEDFTLISEREIAESVIWKEYMVYATLFGIADKVMEQFKNVYPEKIQEFDTYNRNRLITYSYYRSMHRSAHRAAQLKRSGGGGGSSSFGGGGGLSGGGSGGGSR